MEQFKNKALIDSDKSEICSPTQFSGVERVDTFAPEILTADDPVKIFELDEKKDIAKQRKQVLILLLSLYTAGVVATFAIIFFQGFKFAGFTLNDTFMSWLGAAVIGELAGLLGIALSFIFKK